MGSLWTLMTIGGPILLAVALIWAIVQNRRTGKHDLARTEAATRDLYAEENRVAHRDGAVDGPDANGRG